MTKLATRTITVVTLVPSLVAIIMLLPWYHHLAINVVALGFSVLGAYESANFFRTRGLQATPWLVPIFGAALPATAYLEVSGWIPAGSEIPVLVALASIILLREVVVARERDFAGILPRIAASMTVLVYPGLFMTYIIKFSVFPDASITLVVFLLMVFANDTLAYLVGSLWGKNSRRIIPVSANKSVVGFIGGIAGTFIFAIAAWFLFPDVFFRRVGLMIATACAVAIATILGDLAESAMKRSSDLKDSGVAIPGRGGVLDSIDSILLAAPVCYYLLMTAVGK